MEKVEVSEKAISDVREVLYQLHGLTKLIEHAESALIDCPIIDDFRNHRNVSDPLASAAQLIRGRLEFCLDQLEVL